MISELARFIADESSEDKYIWVVVSESCPIPSLITERGIFLLLAILAHE